ncbi:hypothetical protein AMJ80_03550 [bacterium SM23_31]|nr:MAG: hypothetical protein AMJ80_03550 [bacterium SM23_31]
MAGYTAVTNVAELVPEITLAVDYIYQDKSLGRALVNYQDITGQPGVTAEFPRFTEVVASTGVSETAAPASHQMDLSMPTLTVARRAVYVGPSDLAVASATGNLATQIGEAMGMAMVKAIDASIFGIVTATTNWTTGTGVTNGDLTLAYIRDGILLLEKNEVDDPLMGVLHPHQWDMIRATFMPVTVATNTTAITIGNVVSDAMLSSGRGNFLGVNWFISNRIGSGTVSATANCYNGLLFSKRGIGYAFKWMAEQGIEADRAPDLGLTKLVLNWADSSGVVYDSAVCKLYSTSS